jgi:CubicO group peptidase (beta-lactamase class C family)
MKLATLSLLLIASATLAQSPATPSDPTPAARYDTAFLSGDTQTIWDNSSPELQKVFGSPEKLKAFRDSALGPKPAPGDVNSTTERGAETLVRTATAAGRTLEITWTVHARTGQILGLKVTPVARAAAPAKAAQIAPPTDAQVTESLRTWVDTHHVAPAIVVGIIDDAGGQRVIAHGKRELGKPDDVTPDTLFEIGSVTKVFTTVLLQEMVDRRQVSLLDPIGKHLPHTVKSPTRNGRQITLLDLATQTSGLPSAPTNAPFADGDDPWADYTAPLLYNFLSTHQLTRDPGSQYEYSNVGMGLLGHVLGLAAKSDYESLVTARICDPLQMTSTRITLTPDLKSRLATGHSASGPPVVNWRSDALLADGALFSSPNDMLKFLAANMSPAPKPADPAAPLKTAMRTTHRPRKPAGPLTQIGLGWHVTTLPGQSPVTWHNGATGGYHAYIGFNPKLRRGVVLLSNSANDIDPLAQYLLGQTPTLPHPELPRQRRTADIDPKLLDQYVGRYQAGPAGVITITRDGRRLLMAMPNQPRLQLLPESETAFFPTAIDAQVTFTTNPANEVTHLTLRQEGQDNKAERIK